MANATSVSEQDILNLLINRASTKNLEPRKPGHVWAILFYPGGRKELVQVELRRVRPVDEASANLASNRKVHVSLSDAVKLERTLRP